MPSTESQPHSIACLVCLTEQGRLAEAECVHVGQETDEFRCREHGHTFGLGKNTDESDGLAWPPNAELTRAAVTLGTRRAGNSSKQ